jgi:rhodanese-related sulfurtransferase
MRTIAAWLSWPLLVAAGTAAADMKMMIGVDPSDREALMISVSDLETTLTRVVGQTVRGTRSKDLGDIMRSTRTGEYDIYVAPAHVAASALAHGYTLVGSTDRDETYQLVAREGIRAPADLKGGKLYLTQQDSVAAYRARGMLNEAGQSLKTFEKVFYRSTAGAGLFSIDASLVDATVAKRPDVEAWLAKNPGKPVVLLTSRAVPGGMSVVLKKSIPEATRAKLENWFLTGGTMAGIGKVAFHSDLANYRYVAALGNWTPSQLPGATIVTAKEVVDLQQRGVVVVDVRTTKEFNDRRIRGAISIPYAEKSLKDVAFDPAPDEWKGPAQLDKTKPAIFHCNGAECWKSYKASKVALASGFKTVYWFRGGFPEWEAAGLPIDSSGAAAADAGSRTGAQPAPTSAVARTP